LTRAWALPLVVAVAGCAAPFAEVRVRAALNGVEVAYCGGQSSLPGSVLRSMEPPSAVESELHGGMLAPSKELRACVRIVNHAARQVQLDRSLVELKCPRERQNWVPDSDDQRVRVPAGESRQLWVGFHYNPIEAGEQVELVLDRALTLDGRPLKVQTLVLRRK